MCEDEIIKFSDFQGLALGTCRICKKLSATGRDHLDCVQMRRIELEDEDLKGRLAEKVDLAENPGGLGVEVRALLEHLSREKDGRS